MFPKLQLTWDPPVFKFCYNTYQKLYKQMKSIIKANVAALSQRLQRILLHIHQYNIRILYKLATQLFIVEWLSRHNKNQDEEIWWMKLNISVVETCTDLQECLKAEEVRCAMHDDDHLSVLFTCDIWMAINKSRG